MEKPSLLGLVSYQVFPALMGGQKCIADFYAHLSRHATITLAASKENATENSGDFIIQNFLYNHWKGILNLRYIYRLVQLVKEKKCSAIIVEHSYFGWLGWLLKKITKTKLVIRLHNIEAHRFRDMQRSWWWVYQYYERWICNKADHLWFTSSTDKNWMISHWDIPITKCTDVYYGVDKNTPPTVAEKRACRETLLSKHQLTGSTKLFLFNGTLDYIPNSDALRIIISELLPRLVKRAIDFRVFICGNRITGEWEKVLKQHPQIIFEGFVQDIATYFKGTDCFISPVTLGSGLKTKLVEALANNQDIISVVSGANGIDPKYAGNKIQLITDYDWDAFTDAMCAIPHSATNDTPALFYIDFNWQNIVQKAVLSLQQL